MALIKLGSGVIDIRGKFGGVYFSRDRSGLHQTANYSKRGWHPSKRQRSGFAGMWGITDFWKIVAGLGYAYLWKSFAETRTWINSVGEPIHLTGWNWFLHFNWYRYYSGLKPILIPPDHVFYYQCEGWTIPDCQGQYRPSGWYSGVPYFKRIDGAYYIWRSGHNRWSITTDVGMLNPNRWDRLKTWPPGEYEPVGTHQGWPLVSGGTE